MKEASASPDEFAFRFRSGRLCLDLLATIGDRDGAAFDRWRRPRDLARWCVEAGLLQEPPAASPRQLDSARQLRETIHRLLLAALAGRPAEQPDRQALNGWAVRTVPAPQLVGFGRPVVLSAPRPLEAALAAAARDAVALLAEGPLERVRQCAADDCSVWFLDLSRPGRRRWCSMDGCGNREKKAAFRSRSRGSPAHGRGPAAG